MSEHFKNFMDFLSLGTFIAVLTQAIPIIAGLFTIIWGYYRIKEIRLTNKIHEAKLAKLLKD
jgi:hypothetical protein